MSLTLGRSFTKWGIALCCSLDLLKYLLQQRGQSPASFVNFRLDSYCGPISINYPTRFFLLGRASALDIVFTGGRAWRDRNVRECQFRVSLPCDGNDFVCHLLGPSVDCS